MTTTHTTCPGCGLTLPPSDRAYDRKFNASAECWEVFERVIAEEFQNAVLFGQVHQLTVDAYAVQHAGGVHPDKSVCIHLTGLCLMVERGVKPTDVPPLMQRIAARGHWPHLEPPTLRAELTVSNVVDAASPIDHADRVRAWASAVWQSWHPHHEAARALADEAAGDPTAGR
jgi:hypothetical protein